MFVICGLECHLPSVKAGLACLVTPVEGPLLLVIARKWTQVVVRAVAFWTQDCLRCQTFASVMVRSEVQRLRDSAQRAW